LKAYRTEGEVIQGDAVDEIIYGFFPVSAGRDRKRSEAANRRRREGALWRRDRARYEQTQIQKITAVERQRLDHPTVHDMTNRSRRTFDQVGIGGHRHDMSDVSDLQLEVLRDPTGHLQREVLDNLRLKSLRSDFD
jgi:hypothetical protein